MDKESIDEITSKLTDILIKKNQDYGGASFDLGLNGNMVHLWDKVKRYRSMIEKNSLDTHFEGLEDTLFDIMGYAVIGLHILSNENIEDKIHG